LDIFTNEQGKGYGNENINHYHFWSFHIKGEEVKLGNIYHIVTFPSQVGGNGREENIILL